MCEPCFEFMTPPFSPSMPLPLPRRSAQMPSFARMNSSPRAFFAWMASRERSGNRGDASLPTRKPSWS
jgi:hypothetical protein